MPRTKSIFCCLSIKASCLDGFGPGNLREQLAASVIEPGKKL